MTTPSQPTVESRRGRKSNVKREKRIAVADAETDPFLNGRVPEPFLWGFYDGEVYQSFNRTADFVAYLREQNCICYAHNGGRFDWHYLLPFLDPFTKLLVINGRVVRFKFGRADCRDSFSILPESLDRLTGEKIKIDYSWFERTERVKHFEAIKTYLKNDCVILHRFISAFVSQYGNAVTLAGAAFKQFAKVQADEAYRVTNGRDDTVHRVAKPFYYGGRTQAFETGIFNGNFHVYDINSAYPFAMSGEHPAGSDFTIRGEDCSAPVSPTSFYTIDATSMGALPIRKGIRLDFPSNGGAGHRGTFHATGHEIISGLQTRTLKIHRILKRVVFHETVNFSPYVEHFWNLKRKARAGSPERQFAKLFLNSLYGKMAANPERYHNYMTVPNDCVLAAESDDWDLSGILPGGSALMIKPIPEPARMYYNMATAASITGKVRAMLWETICKLRQSNHRVLYCDTDSVLTDGELEEGSQLGQWKRELDCSLAALGGRKLYALRVLNPQSNQAEWKTASKGVQLTAAEIVKVASGKTVRYDSPAPTFSLTSEPSFIHRVIKLTS